MSKVTSAISERTIADFGDQWQRFQNNEGFYGSSVLLADVLGPLLKLEDVRQRHVADIGSGTGRIVRMLMDAGADRVFAVEPSDAYPVLVRNVSQHGSRVECARVRGDELPRDREFDLVFSIGVLHHIPEPAPVVRAAFDALKPGGRMLVWLYGREGNGPYLALARPLRAVTTRLPHAVVHRLARWLVSLLVPYIWLCSYVALPLRGYFVGVYRHMARDAQELIIYDQLRPAYAKYYSRAQAIALLEAAGFSNVRAHHRHGYSWTVIGTKTP